MSRNLDQILAVIDTGLQTGVDVAYGNDHHDTCWRCRRACGVDLCGACREELLAEVEPTPPPPTFYQWPAIGRLIRYDLVRGPELPR